MHLLENLTTDDYNALTFAPFAEKARIKLEELEELGGHTTEGIADVLISMEIKAITGDAGECAIAEYIKREVPGPEHTGSLVKVYGDSVEFGWGEGESGVVSFATSDLMHSFICEFDADVYPVLIDQERLSQMIWAG